MQNVLGLIRRIRYTQSTLRPASIREKKGPLLGKIQVKNPHQRSPHAISFHHRSHEETERHQQCARSKAWNLAKQIYKLNEKDRATFYSPSEECILSSASTKEPEERKFVVDSGASMHKVSKRDLNLAELETMRTSKNPTTVTTANGEVQTREEATVYVKELDLFVTVMLLEETPAVLSLGKPCEDHGYTYHWTSGQKPHRTPNGKSINCNIANYVPFVVPGLSTSSSTSSSPASSTSSSQDTVISTENPATERSEIMSEESRGNPSRGSAETENTNRNEDDEELRSELLQDVPEWLQDFKENQVDKNVQTHQYSPSSSHELPMELRAKVVPGSGKPSIYTHFRKDQNCDICLRTIITMSSCRRRTGSQISQ